MRKNYKVYLLIFGLLMSVNTWAQLVSTFDDLALGAESYWNGSDGSGKFTSGQAVFTNNYNADWDFWSGFAYSNSTDNTSAGFMNQYSAIAGKGNLLSANYGVCYAGSSDSIIFENEKDLFGVYITNSTYAALSMKQGDDFSKKFGGESGTDPDWFLLRIAGFDANSEPVGVVEFYLADFRFENSADDYIVDDWQLVDLSSLKGVSVLTFSLNSSDTGDWGMNTPGYFCLDDLILNELTNIAFTVTDGTNPLQGVELEFAGSTLTTDINGWAQFTSVSPTTQMEVSASKDGFETLRQTINGFYDQEITIALLPTAINDAESNAFLLYPNPANDIVNIKAAAKILKIQIFNFSGQLVFDELVSNDFTSTISIDQFKQGVYLLEVTTINGVVHQTLVKK